MEEERAHREDCPSRLTGKSAKCGRPGVRSPSEVRSAKFVRSAKCEVRSRVESECERPQSEVRSVRPSARRSATAATYGRPTRSDALRTLTPDVALPHSRTDLARRTPHDFALRTSNALRTPHFERTSDSALRTSHLQRAILFPSLDVRERASVHPALLSHVRVHLHGFPVRLSTAAGCAVPDPRARRECGDRRAVPRFPDLLVGVVRAAHRRAGRSDRARGGFCWLRAWPSPASPPSTRCSRATG